MSETIIPQSGEGKQKHPGENQKYVNSRNGAKAEQSRTKQASMKHQNPEFFKRQSDRKNSDNTKSNENVGRGVGQIGKDTGRGVGQIGKDQMKDKGRGVGETGRDQGMGRGNGFQPKEFTRGTMY